MKYCQLIFIFSLLLHISCIQSELDTSTQIKVYIDFSKEIETQLDTVYIQNYPKDNLHLKWKNYLLGTKESLDCILYDTVGFSKQIKQYLIYKNIQINTSIDTFDKNSELQEYNICIRDHTSLWITNTFNYDHILYIAIALEIKNTPSQLIYFLQNKFSQIINAQFTRSMYKYTSFMWDDTTLELSFIPEDRALSYLEDLLLENTNASVYIQNNAPCNSTNNVESILLENSPNFYNLEIFSPTISLQSADSCFDDRLSHLELKILKTKTKYHRINTPLYFFILENEDVEQYQVGFIFGSVTQNHSLLLNFTNSLAFDKIQNLFKTLSLITYNIVPIKLYSKDIVISEILWMGSLDNNLISYPYDEAFELYNTTNNPIVFYNVNIICSKDMENISLIIPIRNGLIIWAREYYVISSSIEYSVRFSDFISNRLGSSRYSIHNETRQCALWQGESLNISSFSSIKSEGILIDLIGDGEYPFNLEEKSQNSSIGIKIKGKHIGAGYRSMEKKALDKNGTVLSNWKTNSTSLEANHLLPHSFNQYLFHSLGRINSITVESERSLYLKINEVLIHGSIPNDLINSRVLPKDIFIELKNISINPINLTGYYLKIVNEAGEETYTFLPVGHILNAGELFVISANNQHAVRGDVYVDKSLKIKDNTMSIFLFSSDEMLIDQIGNRIAPLKKFVGLYNKKSCVYINCVISRSVERNIDFSLGSISNSWYINSFLLQDNNYTFEDYRDYTFTSLGVDNSPVPFIVHYGELLISEIHWGGGINSDGTRNLRDNFIELYNNSSRTLTLDFMIITGASKTEESFYLTLPRGTVLPKESFLIIYNTPHSVHSIYKSHIMHDSLYLSRRYRSIILYNALHIVVDEVSSTNNSWPAGYSGTPTRSMSRSLDRELIWNDTPCMSMDSQNCTSIGY